ncbi:unnamed protein product [Calypogeia fissa]
MRVENGLTKVRNPHTSIYKRYEERRARNDASRPLNIESTDNEEYDAARAPRQEEDIDDLDTIDDADEALQGLSLDLQNDVLTRIPADTDASDVEEWENEQDLDMYPTIDESQIEDDEDAPIDRDFVVPSQPSSSRTYRLGLNVRNDVETNRAYFSQQRYGVEEHHSNPSRSTFFQSNNDEHNRSFHHTNATPTPIAHVVPTVTNPNMPIGFGGFEQEEWNRLLHQNHNNDNNNTRNFFSQP